MIGGGNPDPSDLARIDLSADSVQSSLFAIGGGNPDPGQSPNIGILAETDQASLIIMGIVSPNDSPLVNIAADSNGSSIRMVGGGTPDPSDVSLELRSAAHDSARISIQVGSASMGIEMRNSSDQITAQLSGNGLGLFVDAGSSSAAPIGTRFRDNAVVAWGNVQAGGSLASDFGVLSVSHPSSGQYTITLNNSAASLDNLIPTAIAEVSAIPVTATAARLLTVNQLTPNSFAVYITTGGYTPIDNNFVFMVTAR